MEVTIPLREGAAIVRKLLKGIIRKIRAFEEEGEEYPSGRPYLWYIAGRDTPEISWIDHALEADYRRNPKWQNPTILSYYPDRDPREVPDWEPGKRGFMEPIWWVAVIVFGLLVTGGIIWGLMNRAGA
jgi:hypothetical protein